MATLSPHDIYEKYVKPLPTTDRLRLIAMAVEDLARQAQDRPRLRISALHGLGKEIWDGIDAQEYVNTLRGEWDERL
ncbi:MAG: hypothetical protein AB1714_29510 [Acidobacteriota bacterium]